MKTHLLLDIEGTTCPFSFIVDVLFPYAEQNLATFLESHQHEDSIIKILAMANKEWAKDNQPGSISLREKCKELSLTPKKSTTKYLQYLMSIDQKSTALKDLQGKIWKQGYKDGALKSTLFEEANECIRRWKKNGLILAVYSSGSVEAQKLLYQHTQTGNLAELFSHWFDTHTGPKKSQESYELIAKEMGTDTKNVIFISDNGEECDAAKIAGMQTLFSLRANNPDQDPKQHHVINNLNEVDAYTTDNVST